VQVSPAYSSEMCLPSKMYGVSVQFCVLMCTHNLCMCVYVCACVCVCVCVCACVFVVCSEFDCVRLYATTPPVYYVIELWRILGPAPITLNPGANTIPHNGLPSSAALRNAKYKNAKADSSTGAGDGSPFYIMNMWALLWGTNKPRFSSACYKPSRKDAAGVPHAFTCNF